jgi:hypothetical protein
VWRLPRAAITSVASHTRSRRWGTIGSRSGARGGAGRTATAVGGDGRQEDVVRPRLVTCATSFTGLRRLRIGARLRSWAARRSRLVAWVEALSEQVARRGPGRQEAAPVTTGGASRASLSRRPLRPSPLHVAERLAGHRAQPKPPPDRARRRLRHGPARPTRLALVPTPDAGHPAVASYASGG